MAITERDLSISNISYTNKDFGAIYTELLDIAKKLSNKFDPTASNESDPFIVLLKLLAFVGDKINYNVDKNILERFTTSLTQETSMQDLTERLGYHMHYYNSAITEVTFSCNKTLAADITIPIFSKLQDSTGEIQYVTASYATINKDTGYSEPVSVYQGELSNLTVLDSQIITEQNLDENNRVYFPEYYVAENGIFICDTAEIYTPNEWTVVPYINADIEYGTKAYMFGYDSTKSLPYVQFPEWIADIIGDGLIIKYLVTKGSAGNTAAKTITSLTSLASGYTLEGAEYTDIGVTNTNAATSGLDPETIDEACDGLKKTLGTFSTLVTCRDYANALYKAYDNAGAHQLVSNIQVGDRRTDINYSCPVTTYTAKGPKIINKPSSSINAYDLCLYPLQPGSVSNNAAELVSSYQKTFTGVSNHVDLQDAVEQSKSLSHTYKQYKEGDIYTIKNYYALDCVISTTYKVNKLEQADILKNVRLALAKKYSARDVNFGYEIVYDDLIKTIQDADSRIKLVTLYEPELAPAAYLVDSVDATTGEIQFKDSELSPHITTVTDNTESVTDADWFKFVVAKNILSGRVEAFEYEDTFDYGYNESCITGLTSCFPCDLTNFEKIGSFTSKTNIGTIPAGDAGYTLKANEVIQFTADNYNTTKTYPYGIYYYLCLAGNTSYQSIQIASITDDGSDITVTFTNNSTRVYSSTNDTLVAGRYTIPIPDSVSYDISDFIQYANTLYQYVVNGVPCNFPQPGATNRTYIKKNEEYKLGSGDKLVTVYTDSNQQQQENIYTTGAIIRPTFDMYSSAYRVTPRQNYTRGETAKYKQLKDGTQLPCFMLEANQEIEYRELAEQKFSKSYRVYWHLNAADNKLVFSRNSSTDKCSYILQTGEELFVCDPQYMNLFVFGSGSKLTTDETPAAGSNTITWNPVPGYERVSDITAVYQDGLSAITDYFSYKNFSTAPLTINEQTVITLCEGDTIYTDTQLSVSDNVYQPLSSSSAVINYKISDETSLNTLPTRLSNDSPWYMRALLDISCGPEDWQVLDGNQTVAFKKYVWNASAGSEGEWQASSADPITLRAAAGHDIAFKFDTQVQADGAENGSLLFINLLATWDTKHLHDYPLLYCADTTAASIGASAMVSNAYDSSYYSVSLATGTANKITLKVPAVTNCADMFMLYSVTAFPKSYITGVTKVSGTASDTTTSYAAGLHIFKVNTSNNVPVNIVLKNSGSEALNLVISNIKIVKTDASGYVMLNKNLGLEGLATLDDLLTYLNGTVTNPGIFKDALTQCNLLASIEPSTAIETTYPLDDGRTFFDVNNLANMWVLPEIDFREGSYHIGIAQNCCK